MEIRRFMPLPVQSRRPDPLPRRALGQQPVLPALMPSRGAPHRNGRSAGSRRRQRQDRSSHYEQRRSPLQVCQRGRQGWHGHVGTCERVPGGRGIRSIGSRGGGSTRAQGKADRRQVHTTWQWTRFHVCFATTTDSRPSVVTKAGRKAGGKAVGKARAGAKPPIPPPAGVQRHAVLIAREQSGQVTIKKLFARFHRPGPRCRATSKAT